MNSPQESEVSKAVQGSEIEDEEYLMFRRTHDGRGKQGTPISRSRRKNFSTSVRAEERAEDDEEWAEAKSTSILSSVPFLLINPTHQAE